MAEVLDADSRVVCEIDGKGFHRDMQYDLLGQLSVSEDERGVVTTYTADKSNRLLAIRSGSTLTAYQYDGQVMARA